MIDIKKITYEKIVYLILILSPIFDVVTYWHREWFPETSISISTVLRPILPLALLGYIFIKEKKWRWIISFSSIIYVIYGIFHLQVFQSMRTESSYGNMVHELQYVFHYTYFSLLLFLFWYGSKKYKFHFIEKILTIVLGMYITTIYVAIFTSTSTPTYIEGIGDKGWFSSGNAIGSILLLLVCVTIKYAWNHLDKKIFFILYGSVTVYLMFLLGTKTGAIGIVFILLFFILYRNYKKIVQYWKRWVIGSVTIVILLGALLYLYPPKFLERTEILEDMSNIIIDPATGKRAHVTGDSLRLIALIQSGEMDYVYMNELQQKTLIDLYQFANHYEINLSDRRILQLVYHTYLWKNQQEIMPVIFGNGYLTNYSEMTLEMETVSIFYNFGILGFLLFLGPYLLLVSLRLKFKRLENKSMFIMASIFALGFSTLAGYTFFNASCMIVICSSILLLYRKEKQL